MKLVNKFSTGIIFVIAVAAILWSGFVLQKRDKDANPQSTIAPEFQGAYWTTTTKDTTETLVMWSFGADRYTYNEYEKIDGRYYLTIQQQYAATTTKEGVITDAKWDLKPQLSENKHLYFKKLSDNTWALQTPYGLMEQHPGQLDSEALLQAPFKYGGEKDIVFSKSKP